LRWFETRCKSNAPHHEAEIFSNGTTLPGAALSLQRACRLSPGASKARAIFHLNPILETAMTTILIIVLLVLLLGGGGYYGHRNYGGRGLGGVLGLVLVIVLIVWLVNGRV
jgi:hypothetical protein